MSIGFAATSRDKVVDVVVGRMGDIDSVDVQEHCACDPTEALVAVDERVVIDDGVKQRSCLRPKVWIRIVAERACPRPCSPRF